MSMFVVLTTSIGVRVGTSVSATRSGDWAAGTPRASCSARPSGPKALQELLGNDLVG